MISSLDHDQEVREARWVEIGEAQRMLAFANEKEIVKGAREQIEALSERDTHTDAVDPNWKKIKPCPSKKP